MPVPLARRREGRRRIRTSSVCTHNILKLAQRETDSVSRRSRNRDKPRRKPAAKNGQIAYARSSKPIAPGLSRQAPSTAPAPVVIIAATVRAGGSLAAFRAPAAREGRARRKAAQRPAWRGLKVSKSNRVLVPVTAWGIAAVRKLRSARPQCANNSQSRNACRTGQFD